MAGQPAGKRPLRESHSTPERKARAEELRKQRQAKAQEKAIKQTREMLAGMQWLASHGSSTIKRADAMANKIPEIKEQSLQIAKVHHEAGLSEIAHRAQQALNLAQGAKKMYQTVLQQAQKQEQNATLELKQREPQEGTDALKGLITTKIVLQILIKETQQKIQLMDMEEQEARHAIETIEKQPKGN